MEGVFSFKDYVPTLGLAEPRLLAFGSLACFTSAFVLSEHSQWHMVKQCNTDFPVDSVLARIISTAKRCSFLPILPIQPHPPLAFEHLSLSMVI